MFLPKKTCKYTGVTRDLVLPRKLINKDSQCRGAKIRKSTVRKQEVQRHLLLTIEPGLNSMSPRCWLMWHACDPIQSAIPSLHFPKHLRPDTRLDTTCRAHSEEANLEESSTNHHQSSPYQHDLRVFAALACQLREQQILSRPQPQPIPYGCLYQHGFIWFLTTCCTYRIFQKMPSLFFPQPQKEL